MPSTKSIRCLVPAQTNKDWGFCSSFILPSQKLILKSNHFVENLLIDGVRSHFRYFLLRFRKSRKRIFYRSVFRLLSTSLVHIYRQSGRRIYRQRVNRNSQLRLKSGCCHFFDFGVLSSSGLRRFRCETFPHRTAFRNTRVAVIYYV